MCVYTDQKYKTSDRITQPSSKKKKQLLWMWWKLPYHRAIWPKILHDDATVTRGTEFKATLGMLAYGEHTDTQYHNVVTIKQIYMHMERF